MNTPSALLIISRKIQDDFIALGFSCDKGNDEKSSSDYFDELITNKALRKKTEKLFKDGHHARAVEEAYKLLDNIVKSKAGMSQSSLTGASLMQKTFTPNKPILKLNACGTQSEFDEDFFRDLIDDCGEFDEDYVEEYFEENDDEDSLKIYRKIKKKIDSGKTPFESINDFASALGRYGLDSDCLYYEWEGEYIELHDNIADTGEERGYFDSMSDEEWVDLLENIDLHIVKA